MTRTRAAGPGGFSINRDILDQVLALADELGGQVDSTPPRLDALLNIRGVLEQVELEETPEQREKLETGLIESFARGLDDLAQVRDEEGARLAVVVDGHLDEITRLVGAAGKLAETQPATLNRRPREKVGELRSDEAALSAEPIAKEVALLLARADGRGWWGPNGSGRS